MKFCKPHTIGVPWAAITHGATSSPLQPRCNDSGVHSAQLGSATSQGLTAARSLFMGDVGVLPVDHLSQAEDVEMHANGVGLTLNPTRWRVVRAK